MNGCKKCMKLNCCSHGGEGEGCVDYMPPTNANRLRAMTDEDLAEFIAYEIYAPHCPVRFCQNGIENCGQCWVKWLRQEIEI